MKESSLIDLAKSLREQGKISSEEVLMIEADILIAKNVVTNLKRVIEHIAQNEKKLLKG